MLSVIIPVVFLILVGTVKKIPLIGGKLTVAFVGSALLAFLLGGVYSPLTWLTSWLEGLDKLGMVMLIVIFGSLFSGLQIRTGAMSTVLDILRALLGKSAQGLVLAALIAMYVGGALMETVAAVAVVVGVLVVPILDDMGMSPELICALLVTGGSMGAIMPPISNALIISTGIIGIDIAEPLSIGYITIGIGLVFCSLFFCKVYVGKKYSIPPEMIPTEKARVIFVRNWKKLVPIFCLLTMVLLNSIPQIKYDLPGNLLRAIPIGEGNVYTALKAIPVLGHFTNNIVLSIIFACVVSLLMNLKDGKALCKEGVSSLKSTRTTLLIQVMAGLFLGAFAASGQTQLITQWASGLNGHVLKLGGGFAIVLAGMLLGAQSTAQSLLTPLLAPAWFSAGVTKVNAAVASAHLAAAGQGLPPASLNTFVVAGLVGSIIKKPVDPLKSMFYASFHSFYLGVVGLIFLYI